MRPVGDGNRARFVLGRRLVACGTDFRDAARDLFTA